jgi:hypothetical protein
VDAEHFRDCFGARTGCSLAVQPCVISMGMDMHRRYQGPEIPLELLRTAAAVEYLGSYFQAGRHLGLSQPSLSARLKRLEKIVGNKIFERSSAGLRPTKYGEVIIEHALRVLSADC